MSQPTADTVDDILYCARYGELEELTNANFPTSYLLAADESGNTALHMACANGHLEVVKYLVEKIASLDDAAKYINYQNEQGNAALHWAALNGHLEIVKLLVTSHGADMKIKNSAGRSPIYEAQAYNHDKVAEFFLSAMVEENDESAGAEEEQDVVEQGPSSGSGTSQVTANEHFLHLLHNTKYSLYKMGYCSRCGEISIGGKCRKCGGRAVASIATGLGADGHGSVVDRWQSQYASSILGTPDEKPEKTTSTPPLIGRQASRSSYSRSSPSLAARRCCANCNKRLYADTLSYVEGDSVPQHYCADCYTRLYRKGSCRQCFKNVFRKDAHIEHNGKFWHKDCFTCRVCRTSLGDEPMVDLTGRPCCEPCLMAQQGQKHAKIANAHEERVMPSPDQVPASPTLNRFDSVSSLSSFASSNASPSPFMRPRLDTHLFKSNDASFVTSPVQRSPQDTISRATTPALSQASSGSVRSIDSVFSNVSYQPLGGDKPSRYNRQRTNSMPSLAQEAISANQGDNEQKSSPPSLQRQRRQSTYSSDRVQRCHQCHDIASGITIRLPKADGYQIYHQACLRCAGCKDIFTESDFISDGDAIYHPQCRLPSVGGVRCVQCFKPVNGKYFKNNGKPYHPECFTCTSCVSVLDPSQPFFEIKGEAFCEPCTDTQMNKTKKPQAKPQVQPHPSPIEDIDVMGVTSKIFAKRTKALPQLGGTPTCPRCVKSVGFLEETPGPRASRWHKKCLVCGGCKKRMDSSATVLEGSQGEWVPFCRACRGFDTRT